MVEIVKAFLSKSLPSWTLWLGVVWAVISGLPDVLTTVVGWFGPVTPELTTKVVAVSMLLARLRSVAAPVITALLAKETEAK